jgi:uncharacterized protein with beta-barrel porin domain
MVNFHMRSSAICFLRLSPRCWLAAVAIAMAVFAAQPGARAQELIGNGSFETGCAMFSTNCPPWVFTGGATVTGIPFSLGLGGIANFSGVAGSIGQTALVTRPGIYNFSFWYVTSICCSVQPTASVQLTASVGGQTAFNQTLAAVLPLTQFATQVTLPAGSAEVLFAGSTFDNGVVIVDDVSLTLLRAFLLRDLLPAGASINQLNVASAIDKYSSGGGTLPPGFLALYGLTGDALANALSQTSGEAGASVAPSTFQAWNGFFNMIFDPFAQNRSGFGTGGGAMSLAGEGRTPSDETRLAYAAVTPKGAPAMVTKAVPHALAEPRWSVWGGGYGGSARTDGNVALGSHDTTSRAYGFAVGADHRLTPDTAIGFALAGGGTSFGLDRGLGGGNSDLFQASIYARQNWGAAYLMGAFGYGWQDITTSRMVTVAGTDKLEADFNANTLAGRAEGGWRFGSPFAAVTPYAAVQMVSLDLPGYTERAVSGADTFALSYAGRTDTQTRSEFGARFDYAMPMQTALLTLRGRAAWAHDYSDNRVANAGFLALPGSAFTVNGATADRDLLLVSAGAELTLRNGFSIAGSFEGEFSGNSESYAGKGSVRYRW